MDQVEVIINTPLDEKPELYYQVMMSILFSGDFHANAAQELSLITKKSLVKKFGREKYDNIRYHVILGDGGFMWPGNYNNDLFNYKALARRPFPVLCVIGNHEPILGMSNTAEVDIGIGEKVLLVNNADPFVAYLKRGKVYTIDGFRFLALGGALSVDKIFRKPEKSWWAAEYWSEQEKQDIFDLLKTENTFDGVLSHTGPDRVNSMLFRSLSRFPQPVIRDEVALLNDRIDALIQCREWWCGHWHHDLYHHSPEMNRGYQYLYRTTKILDKADDTMIVYNEDGAEER